jgi:cellulose synthase/poly-beta-1,6-N-acetylglucosamine synthase-like glycosyltransferase
MGFNKKAINKIKSIPRETAEDTIVPILIYQEGFKIKYLPDAEVYVKYPSNLKDFIEQKKRTAKAHETLSMFADLKNVPRMKSFKNELFGSLEVFKYPNNIQEFFWTFFLFPIRLYIWLAVFFQRYIKHEMKVDGWKPVQSTK